MTRMAALTASRESTRSALPTYDTTAWPLVRIVAPPLSPSDDEFREHIARIESFYARGGDFAIVVDVRVAPSMSPSHRRMLSEALDRQARAYPRSLRALGMVLRSEVQRGILTAIGWFFRPPYPMKVFTDVEEAEAWCRSALESDAPARGHESGGGPRTVR